MKYKWQDKVRIKSKKELECISEVTSDMLKNAEAIMTIACLVEDADGYIMKEDGDFHFLWTDEMIEGLVEDETKPKFKVGDKVILDPYPCVVTDVNWRDSLHGFVYTVRGFDFGKMVGEEDLIFDTSEEEVDLIPKFGEYGDNEPLDIPTMTTEFVKEHGFPCPKGYQFVDEGGNVINAKKIILEKKKPKYPQTYEECCKVLDIDERELVFNGEYRASKLYWKQLGRLNILNKLLICRDAYWKLYGEEMGLDKPWEPDFSNRSDFYVIITIRNEIRKEWTCDSNAILAFPTEKMRDAFYENFKEEIENCKELL